MRYTGDRRVYCPCGRPLHYPTIFTEAYMVRQTFRFGPLVTMTTSGTAWRIPRHFLVLHGVRPGELPWLAAFYGWRQLRPAA